MIYDRILTVWVPDRDGPALTRRLVPAAAALCGEKSVSDRRFYMAQQAGQRIDKLVELWPCGVEADAFVTLDDNGGAVYRVVKSDVAQSRDGLPVQTLTLRREEAEYELAND